MLHNINESNNNTIRIRGIQIIRDTQGVTKLSHELLSFFKTLIRILLKVKSCRILEQFKLLQGGGGRGGRVRKVPKSVTYYLNGPISNPLSKNKIVIPDETSARVVGDVGVVGTHLRGRGFSTPRRIPSGAVVGGGEVGDELFITVGSIRVSFVECITDSS